MTQERQKAEQPDTQHSDWGNELNKILIEECGNLEITHGELVDGTTSPIYDFIASEKSKSYEEGIRKAVEVVDSWKGISKPEITDEIKAELNQLLK